MRAIVLAGGPLEPSPQVRALAQRAQLVVAADSGLRHARALALTPDLLVGDFDSVAEDDLAAFPGLARERHPADKDALDLELALGRALALGASRVVVLGALGARLDQSLAAIFIAMRHHLQGHAVTLHDGLRDLYPMKAGDARRLDLAAGQRFSLLALDEARLSLSGARYALREERLEFGSGRGVSNRVTAGPLTVTLHAGRLLLVVEYGEE